jgi:Mn-dependent DtxR family transcriptional regulator
MNVLLHMLEQASRDEPVTREDIRRTFRVPDRSAREMIERLRDNGYPVIGTSDTKGYWIAGSDAEMEMFIRNYTAKARTIQKRAEKMCRTFYQERNDEDEEI